MAMLPCQGGRSSLERSLVSHVEWSIVLEMLPTMCRAITHRSKSSWCEVRTSSLNRRAQSSLLFFGKLGCGSDVSEGACSLPRDPLKVRGHVPLHIKDCRNTSAALRDN